MPAWRGKDQKPAWMTNQDTNPNRPRTRKEIMMDVIAKAKVRKSLPHAMSGTTGSTAASRRPTRPLRVPLTLQMHKAMRAKEKRAQEELLEGLDDKANIDIVRALLKPRGNKGGAADGEKRSYKAMLAERSAGGVSSGGASDGAASGDEEFSYDRAVRGWRGA